MAAFFMREVVWQLVGARTWRARQVLYDTCEPDLSERAPHVAPLQKKALSSCDSAFFHAIIDVKRGEHDGLSAADFRGHHRSG